MENKKNDNSEDKKININSINNNDLFENKSLHQNDLGHIKKDSILGNNDNSSNNFLLKRKTKPENDNMLDPSIQQDFKESKGEEKIDIKKQYDFGYSIILLEEKEEGLMEDFLKEVPLESDISDFYNYHLNEEKWQKILHHSILVHYERHLKEEMEKRKKMQNMFIFNMNINMNMNNNIIHPSMMPQMNSIMMANMNNNNGINYPIQMPQVQNINKIKTFQNTNNK